MTANPPFKMYCGITEAERYVNSHPFTHLVERYTYDGWDREPSGVIEEPA